MPSTARRTVFDRCRLPVWVLVGAIISVVMFTGAPARAQWFSPWSVMENIHTPTMGARQFRQYSKILELTSDQNAAAEELLAGYEREYRAIATRMQEISKAINEEYDNDEEIDIWREVWPKVLKNFMMKSEKLDKTFMDDLRVLLDDAQQSRWPEVERLHRRQSTLRNGSRAGEQIDLIDLVDGLRLDGATAQSVAPTLEQYAVDLDRELAARNKFIEDGMDRFFQLWSEWDQEKITQLYKEMGALSQKIVDVNRRYAAQIQAALPPDRQTDFAQRVDLAMYPRVYKQTYAGRVLDAAQKIEDLDDGQREGLKGIRETFERESASINEKWKGALADQEQKHAENPNPWGWGGEEEDERFGEARKQRKELEKKTVDSIKAILTADQRGKLPDKKWKPEFDLDAPPSSISKR